MPLGPSLGGTTVVLDLGIALVRTRLRFGPSSTSARAVNIGVGENSSGPSAWKSTFLFFLSLGAFGAGLDIAEVSGEGGAEVNSGDWSKCWAIGERLKLVGRRSRGSKCQSIKTALDLAKIPRLETSEPVE